MLIATLKMVLYLLGGGVTGAVLNEWFRRRNDKVQAIPLIERVNRLVSPELTGFALARVLDDGHTRKLEEIRNVREYQLTLRNTSTVHLQDVEIQFEFPTEDVEAWAERPTLSKTPPLVIPSVITQPWKKGFRWRIPQFPSTDSMEFTFRAVDPVSAEYEVALYKSDRVVIEKLAGEPVAKTSRVKSLWVASVLGSLIAGLVAILATLSLINHDQRLSTVDVAGCSLSIISSFDQLNPNAWPGQGPFRLDYRIFNTGAQSCVLQSDKLPSTPLTIKPTESVILTTFSPTKPKLIWSDLFIGPDGSTHQTRAHLYAGTQP